MLDLLTYVPFLLEGAEITVTVAVLATVVAVISSLLLAQLRASKIAVVRWSAGFVVEFFRGSSALVQLFWAFYALPLFGIRLSPIAVGVIVLGLNEGSYFSEAVRAAFAAVPVGQTEACVALHLSRPYRFWRIIVPQALPLLIPAFGNMAVNMTKFTALVSLVTIQDLTARAGQVRNLTGRSLPVYSFTLLVYFALALLVGLGIHLLERRVNRQMGRATGPLFSDRSAVPAWAFGRGR